MRQINQMEPWIGYEEKQATMEYLDSGGWLTEFKKTREFEQMIGDYIGSKFVSVVNTGYFVEATKNSDLVKQGIFNDITES